MEVYDPQNDTWTSSEASEVAAMPTAREGLGAVAIGGKLYVAGGFLRPANTVTDILEVYDPVMNSWTSSAAMLEAREDFAFGEIGGKFYVVGGWKSGWIASSLLESYDPVANTWTALTSIPTPRAHARAGVIDNRLLVAGGATLQSPFTITDVVEVYSPIADTDGDGVPDDDDAFPNDPDASTFANFTTRLRDIVLTQDILDIDLKNPNQRGAYRNKLTALIDTLNAAAAAPTASAASLLIMQAIDKLNTDLIPKCDGFFGGKPNNDWIITLQGQTAVYPKLQVLLAALQATL